MRGQEGQRHGLARLHSPRVGNSQMRRQLQLQRLTPRNTGSESHPHQAPQPEGSTPGRGVTRMPDAEGQWGLLSGDPQGCLKQSPLLKGEHKSSYTPEVRTEVVIQKKPGSVPPTAIGKLPGKIGGNWSSPWGQRRWQYPLWGIIYHEDIVLASAILESSLQLISTRTRPTHQPVGISTGSNNYQAKIQPHL